MVVVCVDEDGGKEQSNSLEDEEREEDFLPLCSGVDTQGNGTTTLRSTGTS